MAGRYFTPKTWAKSGNAWPPNEDSWRFLLRNRFSNGLVEFRVVIKPTTKGRALVIDAEQFEKWMESKAEREESAP